jgi:hypothetical protein
MAILGDEGRFGICSRDLQVLSLTAFQNASKALFIGQRPSGLLFLFRWSVSAASTLLAISCMSTVCVFARQALVSFFHPLEQQPCQLAGRLGTPLR